MAHKVTSLVRVNQILMTALPSVLYVGLSHELISVAYTVPVKGIAALHAHIARALHAHYTQCPRSSHAVSTHLTCKCTKMRNYTHVNSRSRRHIACKITRGRSTGTH